MESAVRFEGVSFFYPKREIEVVDANIRAVENPDEITQVFASVNTDLPAGMMAVIGQNGYGKSTLLLLAAGRLFPHEGSVTVFGTDTAVFRDADRDPAVEQERNRFASFIYQNMEFESDESVGELMEYVYDNGFHKTRDSRLPDELTRVLELEPFLTKRMQHLAKGQLQRAIIAFSVLYGSRMIVMDEPVFALEEPQKDRAFGFLMEYSRTQNVPVYYSVHNLELSQKYSDHLLLFERDRNFVVGPTAELFTRDRIEAAYQAPMDTLHRRDSLYREVMIRAAE